MKFILVLLSCAISVNAIKWESGNWAMDCDFIGKDLMSRRSRGDQCGGVCGSTPGCTHFVWSNHQGGTCWMKTGGARREDAIYKKGFVCGIRGGSGGNPGPNSGSTLKKGSLIFSSEFNSNSDVSRDWIFKKGGNGWGNNELQHYTDRNTRVSNGILTIEARKENYGNNRFTSARLRSKRQFKYGVFEARAKVPNGRGTWPAFWLLYASPKTRWPDDGEIDILEHVGYETGRVHANIHCKAYNHAIGTGKGNSIWVNNVDTQYHLYQLEWRPDRIRMFVDNKEYFTYYKERNSYDVWPFDNPHDIILNLAVGGNWGGQKGIDEGAFPQRYYVDYVRVYNLA